MWETSTTLAVAGRSVMTLTGPRESFPTLLRHLDGSTPRRRFFRRTTTAIARTPLLRLIVKRDAPPPPEPVRDLLAGVDARLGGSPAGAMAVVHGVSSWPGRSYVVALDEADRPRFFAKVTDQSDDEHRLDHEHEMLDAMASEPLQGWRAPRSYGVTAGDGVAALVLQCLPTGSVNLTGSDVLRRLPLRPTHGPQSVERDGATLDWLRAALEHPTGPAFRSLLDRAVAEPIGTALVHGDIGTRNAFVVPGSDPWLVDWEFSSLEGPRAADLVSGELNITLDELDLALPELWRRLCVFASAHNFTRQELALAVLYLAHRGHQRASLLVSSLERPEP